MAEKEKTVFNSEAALPPSDIRDFNRFEMVHFKKGAYIIRQGTKVKYAYFLIHGSARLSTLTYDGSEVIYDYRKANNSIRCIIGGLSVYQHSQLHRSSAIAEAECTCRRMTCNEFRSFLHAHPNVTDAFIGLFMERWSVLDDNFLLKQSRNTTGQVCAVLLSYARLRGGEYYLDKKFNNSNIARLVGAHRVTVSRIIQELIRLSVIQKTPDGLHLLNMQELDLYRAGIKMLPYRSKQNET